MNVIKIIESNEKERDYTISEVINWKKGQLKKEREVGGSTKIDEQIVHWLEKLQKTETLLSNILVTEKNLAPHHKGAIMEMLKYEV